ncbi:MAG: sulfurtransferase [Desulfobacterales bacterium]|nr:MAG: sulfurtransferase [Desulfobacterales bacterium]
MIKKRITPILFLLFVWLPAVSCTTTPDLESHWLKPLPKKEVHQLPLLVETEWLAENSNSFKTRIIDFGRTVEDYLTGHIPDAVFVNRNIVWDEVDGIVGMLPSVETIISTLETAGISDDHTIVIYDAFGGLWASRLFWALEYLGHNDVHILNGGWNKWAREGRNVQVEAFTAPPGHFTGHIQPGFVADKAWILKNLTNPGVQVIDARSVKEYMGEDIRSAKGGHIPGAVNLNWISNLAHDDFQTILPIEDLRKLYESQGISKDKIVVTYCQTGVRGAHIYFVLRHLGFSNVRNYDGSWAEWGNDLETPIETITTN